MKKRMIGVFLLLCLALTSCNETQKEIEREKIIEKEVIVVEGDEIEAIKIKNSISDAFNLVENACVGIYIEKDSITGSGSGVIYKYDEATHTYFVVTNHHVAGEATAIKVYTGGSLYYPATLVGTDSKNDVAVISFTTDVLGEEKTLKSIELLKQDKVDIPTVGQTVFAVGCPQSLENYNVLTSGVVSFFNSTQITTDAAINPGNSGGGLFNLEGRLIGLVNSKTAWTTSEGQQIAAEGRGYAIHINYVLQSIKDIEAKGTVERPVFGIYVTGLNTLMGGSTYEKYKEYLPEGEDRYSYLVISSVLDGGKGKEYGLEIGDVILSLNDQDVKTNQEILTIMSALTIDDTVKVKLYRKSENAVKEITVYFK